MSQYLSRADAPYASARCSLRWLCTKSLSRRVLSTSNRNTTAVVLDIAVSYVFQRGATSRRNASALGFAEKLFRDLRHTLGFEPKFAQQLLQRSRRAECIHTDDAAGFSADITFPAKR